MITLLVIIRKFISFLNTNESNQNLAYSLTLSFIFALIPLNLVVHPLLIFLLIIFNGNFLIFIFTTPFINKVTPKLYTSLHNIGDKILTNNNAEYFFQRLINIKLEN